MLLYVSINFHEHILNGLKLIQLKQNYYCQRVGSCRLMMLYISMKFHEDVLNSFPVIEQIGNDHCQISKGNNSKIV